MDQGVRVMKTGLSFSHKSFSQQSLCASMTPHSCVWHRTHSYTRLCDILQNSELSASAMPPVYTRQLHNNLCESIWSTLNTLMKNKGLCDATQVHLVDPSHRDGLLPDIILMQLKMKSESEEKVRFGGNATRTCAGSVWSAHKGGRNNMEWQLCDSLRMEERLETNIVWETMHHLSFVAFIHNLHTHQRTLWEVE